jgi:hypothetical protein
MNYEENELEDYARYMDYITRLIMEEEKELGYYTAKVSIGHINKHLPAKLYNEGEVWGFQYTAKVVQIPIKTKNKWIDEQRYSFQINYNEWKRLQKIETRDKLLASILDGLEPTHKIALIKGLKK